MTCIRKVLLLLVVIVLLSLVSREAMAAPKIEFETMVHDYGKVDQKTKNPYTFKFKNVGDEPLEIKKVKPSCGCTAALISKKILEPGESGEIEVTFHSGNFKKDIRKTIYVETNEAMTVSGDNILGEDGKPIRVHKLFLKAYVNPSKGDQAKLKKERELHMKMSKEKAYVDARNSSETGATKLTMQKDDSPIKVEVYPKSMHLGKIAMNRDYKLLIKVRSKNSERLTSIKKVETYIQFIGVMINRLSVSGNQPGEIEITVNVKSPGTLKRGILYIHINGLDEPIEFPVSWETG